MKVCEFEQGSILWHQERAGKVTGTSLESALGTPAVQRTLLYALVSERMTEAEIQGWDTDAVRRGRELEPYAIKELSKTTNEKYETVGMLISDVMPEFGFSPDAVVLHKETGAIIGGAEIKCPNSKKHIEYVLKDEVPKEYFSQAVLAPFICSDDIQFWDFASYDDRNYERPLFTIRTYRVDIEKDIKKAKLKLESFLKLVNETHEGLIF